MNAYPAFGFGNSGTVEARNSPATAAQRFNGLTCRKTRGREFFLGCDRRRSF